LFLAELDLNPTFGADVGGGDSLALTLLFFAYVTVEYAGQRVF
jgi:hypothetical protein